MTISASALTASALREFLLASLPAQVATRNASRAAKLTTPQAGPWALPSGAEISVSLNNSTFTTVALTSGSRTAAQIAAEVEATAGLAGVASALTDGRLRFTSTATPSGSDTASAVYLGADTTGAMAALGFDPAGESCVRAPLVAPTSKGIYDGEPLVLDPFANGRMLLVLGDRSDVGVPNELRRDERLATVVMRVFVPASRQDYHASREEIQSAVECVVDAISTTSGRQLARAADGDVGFVQVKSVKVAGAPFSNVKQPNFLLDVAELVITARVYQRAVLS